MGESENIEWEDVLFMDKIKTGNLIRDARKRKNYTQSELGDLLGVTNKAVSRWENGESFPDVAILENISNVLDIKIQDIVVGEIQSDNDKIISNNKESGNETETVDAGREENILAEVVRLVKIQDRAKCKMLSCFLLQLAILLYSCFIGCVSLFDGNIVSSPSGMVYFISLAIVFGVLIFEMKIRVADGVPESDAVSLKHDIRSKFCVIQVSLLVWVILSVCVCCGLSVKMAASSDMKMKSIGTFLNINLVTVFLINLIFVAIECFRNVRENISRNMDFGISVAGLYLTALYWDVLHSISENLTQFYYSFFQRTVIVLCELFLFKIVRWCVLHIKADK